MTCLLLVRHVEHVLQNERLLGRTHDAVFSDAGLRRLGELGRVLAHEPVAAVYCGPLRRARETAAAIALPHGLTVRVRAELDELDYGEWSGRRFEELARDLRWQCWNTQRAATTPPNGESMGQLQERMLSLSAALHREHPCETIACITHAEPIRALILHACGKSLDAFAGVDVPPGSITRMKLALPGRQPEFRFEAMPA